MNRNAPADWQSRSRRGLALVLVMLTLAFCMVLAMTFIAGQGTTSGISRNVDRHAHARMIAESGLTTAMEYVNQTDTWRTAQAEGYWLPAQAYAGGTFRVIFEDEDGDLADDNADLATIKVVGTYEGVSHTVSATVIPSVPPASNYLLLVVGNATSLDAEDQERYNQAESWEYTPTLIDDSASQTSFDSAFLDNDVVWVSPTCDGAQLSTKLYDCPIGVITTHSDGWEDLGLLGSAPSTRTGTGFKVTNNTHYITEPYTTGSLTIFSADTDQVYNAASAATGAQVLGTNEAGSGVSLAVIDAGGTLSDSSYAVGRRVFLPWADDSEFDFSTLNNDGRTILQRALVWAAAPPEGPPALAHWMLDETSGTLAVDSRNGHDGEVLGGSSWALGQVIGAMEFDNNDDYISVPSHSDFQVTDALTVTAWVRPESFSSGSDVDVILRKGEGNPNNWQFSLENGKPTLYLDGYDGSGHDADAKLTLNEWSHIAGTWDGSRVRIYIDGQISNGRRGTSESGTLGTDDRPIFIGGRSGAAGYDRFDGKIDDVRFYNYAVSAAEIKVIYEEGEASSRNPRLIALYTFEEVKPDPALAGHWKLDDNGSNGGGLVCGDSMDFSDRPRVNSYDSSLGAYSAATAGSDAMVATNSTGRDDLYLSDYSVSIYGDAYCGSGGTPSSVIDAHDGTINGLRLAQSSNAPIPNASSPTGMPASEGNVNLSSAVTLGSDRTFASLTLQSGAVLTVSGDRTIWCTSDFIASGNAQIVIPNGASLQVYVGNDATIGGTAVLNADTADPRKLEILCYTGTNGVELTLQDSAEVAAVLHTDRDLVIEEDARFYGSATAGYDVTVSDDARIHLDINLPGLGIDDALAVDQTLVNAGRFRGGASGNQTGASSDTGTSVLLDGSNDYIEIPHHDDYLLDSGAIAFWFRTADTSTDQGLFCKDASGYGDGGHLNISINSGQVLAKLSGTSQTYSVGSGSILADTWYHVIFCFGPDGMSLYINGTSVATNTYVGGTGATSGGSGNDEPIGLGIDTSASSSGSVSGYADPLDGQLDDVRIYDYALDATQARNLYAGSALGDSTLPASVIPDSGTYGAALDLLIPDTTKITWPSGGGLQLDQAQTIASKYDAIKLADAVADTNEFTIEAKFTPQNTTQSGPALIATMSDGNTDRNFMVGQSTTRYTSRLRTTDTGDAGSSSIDSDPVLAADQTEHVIISYDGSKVYYYRTDSMESESTLTGDLSGWDRNFHFMIGGESDGSDNWVGTLHRIAIYDRAFNDRQASNVFQGLPPGDGTATEVEFQWNEQQ